MPQDYPGGSCQPATDVIQNDFAALMEAAPFGILILGPDLYIRQINQTALKLLGLSVPPSKLFGTPIFTVIDKSQLPESELRMGFTGRTVTLGKGGRSLSVTVKQSNSKNFLLILAQTKDAVQKQKKELSGSVAYFHFDDIIGQSAALRRVIEMAQIASQNDSNVLLTGESGTGKEMFAQSIHNGSTRKNGPFVPINCGALPKSLIESELFGYDSGSFTGARREGHAGKFEQADGGTLFLDEIGEMPLDVQATLLRALQSREIFRIGGRKGIQVNVRIIAATNIQLSKLVEQKLFRKDLFYRLNIFCIQIPSLREREGDLPILIEYFLAKYINKRTDLSIQGFSPEAFQSLTRYVWPGNIRELQNMIERAIYLTKSEYIEPESLPAAIVQNQSPYAAEPQTPLPDPAAGAGLSLSEMEKLQIENALSDCHGCVEKAAELLKINRRTLYRRLEKYKIHQKDFNK